MKTLYGVIEWINGHPIFNGMKYFTTKENASKYCDELSVLNTSDIMITYTIIELAPGE